MFRPAQTLVHATVDALREGFRSQFPHGEPRLEQALVEGARAALFRQARTNALYTDLEAAILLGHCAEDVLRGVAIRDGRVEPRDWVTFVVAALHVLVGFVREICPGDDGRVCATNQFGDTITLARGQTDGALWLHAVDRAMLFVRHCYAEHPVLDGERLATLIAYTRLPIPTEPAAEGDPWPELLRAVQFVAATANPRFVQRLTPLYLQFQESTLAERLGYSGAQDLRTSYPELFWSSIHPQIVCAVELLKYTGDGMSWVASMNANMLAEEHRQQFGARA